MTDTMHLLDLLRERSYEPQEDAPPREGWFDKPYPSGTLRMVLTADEAQLIAFDAHMCVEWDARFPVGVPLPVILAALTAAEREYAAAAWTTNASATASSSGSCRSHL